MLLAILVLSCTDARQAKIGSLNSPHKIELINCDGSITKTWISTGKVLSEENSDGYYFFDKESQKLIEVSGNVIITRLE